MNLVSKNGQNLIESDGDRPTAYFIDNGGSTDFSRIEGTDLWAELFLGGDAPGMPERFRIQYWINAENFRLQTLVLSFYIAPEAIEDPESFGLEEGDPLEVIWVLEFRPLAEEAPEITHPVISAMPTPAPASAIAARPAPIIFAASNSIFSPFFFNNSCNVCTSSKSIFSPFIS